MSPSSFIPAASCIGAVLSSTGSLGMVPLSHRYYYGTPTPRRSSSPHLLFRSAVPTSSVGSDEASQGSWGSLMHMPCSRTPVGPTCWALAPNCAFSHVGVAFHYCHRVGSHNGNFGAL